MKEVPLMPERIPLQDNCHYPLNELKETDDSS
jgi:hypothetical protein